MSNSIRILGIAGSLRRNSYNRAALQAATTLVPEGAILETFELDDIPIFNQDDDQQPPASVVELKRRIREADAILSERQSDGRKDTRPHPPVATKSCGLDATPRFVTTRKNKPYNPLTSASKEELAC